MTAGSLRATTEGFSSGWCLVRASHRVPIGGGQRPPIKCKPLDDKAETHQCDANAFALVFVTLAVFPTFGAGAIGASDSSLAPLYAVASAKLLGAPAGQNVIVLPPTERSRGMRARRASGAPRTADAATARQVADLLVRQGYQGTRMQHSAPARTGAILLILGEVRFEPPSKPTFARLIIEVVGTDGAREAMEFLLKREPVGWRALKMESAEDVS